VNQPRAATARLFARQRFGARPGLDTMRALLERLGRPDLAFDAVLVAGTNGKGSTAAALASMLRAAGRRVGRYASPHLTWPGERVVVGGVPMSDAAFEEAAAWILPHAEATDATFFEALTALACRRFAEAEVEVAVLEVGLGGRLDATNALEPVASAIASIGLDHQAVLGDTLAAIAREKAGVLRRGRPAWTSARGDARAAIEAEAARLGARLSVLGRDVRVTVRERGWDGVDVTLERPGAPDRSFASPLAGRHQGENLALAALVARDLGATDAAVATGAARVSWPGRAETVRPVVPGLERLRIVLDGAHNPAAAAALTALLAAVETRPQAVLGVGRDKDVEGILATLAPRLGGVHVTRARHSPRALEPADLAERAAAHGLDVAGVHDDPAAAVRAAAASARAEARSDDGRADVRTEPTVLVAGSLYLVGEVRPWLLGRSAPSWERWQ
jgi:dihydrofolate synthase/folylpolyglutamate synthase